MAEVREAKSSGRRGPISKQNLHHIEIHPIFGGGHSVEHHYAQSGGEYKPPASKKFKSLAEAAAHIAGLEKHEAAEPGGKPEGELAEHEPAEMHEPAGEHAEEGE